MRMVSVRGPFRPRLLLDLSLSQFDQFAGGWIVGILRQKGTTNGEVQDERTELGNSARRLRQCLEVLEKQLRREGRG